MDDGASEERTAELGDGAGSPESEARPGDGTRAGGRLPDEAEADPGAFLGRGREFAAESIPGGVGRADERIAGVATQSTGAGARGAVPSDEGWTDAPAGHREGRDADDDSLREKGDSHA
jgi:hypothetical protein